jgi:hypothetical protein
VRELALAWFEVMLPVRGARSWTGSSRSSRVAGRGVSWIFDCGIEFMAADLWLTIIGINQVVSFHAGVVVVLVRVGGSRA